MRKILRVKALIRSTSSQLGFFSLAIVAMIFQLFTKEKSSRFLNTAALLFCYSGQLLAEQMPTAGVIAGDLVQSLGSLARLITAGLYALGLGFAMSSVIKLKQHRERPTQVPLSAIVSQFLVACALLFFPSFLALTGYSVFGDSLPGLIYP